jgi:hypothetical protein
LNFCLITVSFSPDGFIVVHLLCYLVGAVHVLLSCSRKNNSSFLIGTTFIISKVLLVYQLFPFFALGLG